MANIFKTATTKPVTTSAVAPALAPVAPAPSTNVPVAPTTGAVGKSSPGGHVQAWRACTAFAASDTLALVSAVNPWRPGTPGFNFYTKVLAHNPKTVQAALDLAATAGFNAATAQGHLRWLFTWGGAYLSVNGKLYAAPVATALVAPATVAPATTATKPTKAATVAAKK